jgi:hypothetical protein
VRSRFDVVRTFPTNAIFAVATASCNGGASTHDALACSVVTNMARPTTTPVTSRRRPKRVVRPRATSIVPEARVIAVPASLG